MKLKEIGVEVDNVHHIISIKPPEDTAWHNLHYTEGFGRFARQLVNVLAKFENVAVKEHNYTTDVSYLLRKGEEKIR